MHWGQINDHRKGKRESMVQIDDNDDDMRRAAEPRIHLYDDVDCRV